MRQLLEVCHADVGDLGTVEAEGCELFQSTQICQPRVGDLEEKADVFEGCQ